MSFASPTRGPSSLPAPEPVPQLLRDLIHERIGVYFEADRFDVFLDKLLERALEHKCASFLEYYYILKYEEKGPEEWRRIMDAFSVQETYFWREYDQIETLVSLIVPAWFKQTNAPLHIWSAACATGEEPYTIAMALREGGYGNHPIEIIGSDASESALEKARVGIFRERSFRTLPLSLREKYFSPVQGGLQLEASILSKVSFRWANLLDAEKVAGLATAEVIFCRNVFIYFSPAGIKRTVARFAERMPSDGKLFVGSSESLLKLTDDFDLREIGRAFVYVRVARRPQP